MIVELCGTDLLKLVNGENIVVGDNLIVRQTDQDASIVYHETNASAEKYREDALGITAKTANGADLAVAERHEKIRASRKAARDKIVGSKPKREGQRWMDALYAGGCYVDHCSNAWKKGALILYDYDTRRALCEAHGDAEFPNIPKPARR